MIVDTGLVHKFEKRFGQPAAWKRACDFMIAYISQIGVALPDVAAHGLAVAKQYQRGEVDADELARVRVACWRSLDEQKAGSVQRTPEQSLVRAVILLLCEKPDPGEDSAAMLVLFWDLAHGFDSNPDRMASLVEKYFSSRVNGQIGIEDPA
jgi:hypothetical protein